MAPKSSSGYKLEFETNKSILSEMVEDFKSKSEEELSKMKKELHVSMNHDATRMMAIDQVLKPMVVARQKLEKEASNKEKAEIRSKKNKEATAEKNATILTLDISYVKDAMNGGLYNREVIFRVPDVEIEQGNLVSQLREQIKGMWFKKMSKDRIKSMIILVDDNQNDLNRRPRASLAGLKVQDLDQIIVCFPDELHVDFPCNDPKGEFGPISAMTKKEWVFVLDENVWHRAEDGEEDEESSEDDLYQQ